MKQFLFLFKVSHAKYFFASYVNNMHFINSKLFIFSYSIAFPQAVMSESLPTLAKKLNFSTEN